MSIIADNRALTEEFCRYSRLCYDRHLVGAAGGNLSVRIPRKDEFIVTASGVSLRDVKPENLVVVDGYGKIIESPSRLKPSKEINFHLAIYRAKPGVNAVIHVHPTYATVFSLTHKTIPLSTISASLKLKQGTVVPEADPGSETLSLNIRRIVEQSADETTVLLLERHGLVTYRGTIREAFDDAELAEDTAKIAFLSLHLMSLETPILSYSTIVDLTAKLNEHIQCYPTDPPFKREWHVNFDDAGTWVSKLSLGAHTGTHVDVPLHYLKEGQDIPEMPVHKFFGNAIAFDTPKKPGENITAQDVLNQDIRGGDIVLFRTGWERYSGSKDFFNGEWPGFTPHAVESLIYRGVKAIGGDMASADSPKGIREGALSHKRALEAEVPIFEALVNMDKVTGKRFFFIGLPLNIESGEASPIRAIALLKQ